MKKKALFIGASLISAVLYQHHSYNSNVKNLLSDNIEALASDELYIKIICACPGSVDCPIDHTKVYRVIKEQ